MPSGCCASKQLYATCKCARKGKSEGNQQDADEPLMMRYSTDLKAHLQPGICFYNFSNVGFLFCNPLSRALLTSSVCTMPMFQIAVYLSPSSVGLSLL